MQQQGRQRGQYTGREQGHTPGLGLEPVEPLSPPA
jgi:hypothetical protein